MKKLLFFTAFLTTGFIFSSCHKTIEQVIPVNLNSLYQNAISDAIIADSSEICDTLWAVNQSNPRLEWKTINNEQYVLVGNLNRFPGSYTDTSVKNVWGIIWVFIPEQYKSRMRYTSIQNKDTLLRIHQLIGLPPANTNNYIVELWVKPADLYRPAPDPSITTARSGLYFPVNTDTSYAKWFNQNLYDAYFGLTTHLPWTRLGYSYDWAPGVNEVGVSEYCIKPNSRLFVKKLGYATQYLQN